MYTEIKKCRACGSELLDPVLDLGTQYIVDFIPMESENKGDRAPLNLVKCGECHLVQLQHTVAARRLYSKFWYESGINESMREALRNIVVSAVNMSGVRKGDTVLDIGCNDGTLLSYYPDTIRTVGIDPARDLVLRGKMEQKMDVGLQGYFAARAVRSFAPFKIITAIAMFYDLDNPLEFLQDCKEVLDQNGLLVIQMNYLGTMLEQCTLDNVSHEHLTYYSLMSLEPLLHKAELELAGVEINPVNGGSFRLYITHPGAQLDAKISADKLFQVHGTKLGLQLREAKLRLETEDPYVKFRLRAETLREILVSTIRKRAKFGDKIYAYGASTRGTALLQYLGLDHETLCGVAERDTKKYGKKMMGSWLPIYEEEVCRKDADAFLLLPYHFWETIQRREEKFLADGGVFIIPLPEPRVVTAEGEYTLKTQEVTVQ